MDTPVPPTARKARKPPGAVREFFARLLPPLTFSEPVEEQFRAWYLRQARARMRYTMLPAMALLILFAVAGGPFATLRATLFSPEQQTIVDILRFGVIVPMSLAMLLVTYTERYAKCLAQTTPAAALLQGLSFIGLDVLMNEQGYNLSSWMPLVVLAAYMMYGILHQHAVRISSAIVVAYGLAGWLFGLNSGQRNFDFAVIAFASFMGFVIHYGFARAVRHNWFTHQVLSDSANRDSLTGIANRRMFNDHIDRMWNQAVRMHVPVGLLLVDLDQFKAFNDHHGHQAGDACLARVANAIARAARRPLDLAARYGGEEFVVLLYDVRRDRVEEICRDVHASIAALGIAHYGSSVDPLVTASIGAACVEPTIGRRHEGLVQLADEALYAAKEGGRNRTVVMDREYEGLETGAFRTPRARNRTAA